MNPLYRVVIAGACIVIILAGMRAASSLVGFILLATLLAISVTPILGWLVKKGLSRSLALLIIILVVIVGGIGVATFVGTSMAELVQTLPTYEASLDEVSKSLTDLLSRVGIDLSDLLSHEEFDPKRLLKIATTLIGGALNAVSSSIFLFILISLMLVEFSGFEERLQKGELPVGSIPARLFEIRKEVRKFVSITALMGLLTAIGNVILLIILGVDFAILWGILSFLFNFIPAIGAIIAMIPPFLLALLAFGWTKAIIVVVGFILINNIVDNVIKPKLMRGGLDISILEIFLSLMIWSYILGVIGAILAVPITMFVKRILKEFSEDGPPQSPFASAVPAGEKSSNEIGD
ncbi:AI-2E family transporter [Desulfobacterota bacterium AH_259_B03_O07]|nr:AI-2E family transporter [Desulfobacterota bacterium AH_259_B03_O07]